MTSEDNDVLHFRLSIRDTRRDDPLSPPVSDGNSDLEKIFEKSRRMYVRILPALKKYTNLSFWQQNSTINVSCVSEM